MKKIGIAIIIVLLFGVGLVSASTTYTPSSKTMCSGDVCSATIYSREVFANHNNQWKTLPEITTVDWVDGAFRFSYNDGSIWVDIEPFIIYNGNEKSVADIKAAYPEVNINDYITFGRFNHKFALNYSNVPQNLIDNTDYMGFKLKAAHGLTWADVVKTSDYSVVVKDKVKISYADLLESGFTLNLVNKTYLLIGNIAENSEGGVIYLDPVISINSSSGDGILEYSDSDYTTAHDATTAEVIDTTSQTESYIGQRYFGATPYFLYRYYFYFDTSLIPSGVNITDVNLSLSSWYNNADTAFDMVIQSGQPTYPHDPLVTTDYDKDYYSGNGGYINSTDWPGVNIRFNITLNSTGISWIQRGGTTKFCMRSSREINGDIPTGDEYCGICTADREGYEPRLLITYSYYNATSPWTGTIRLLMPYDSSFTVTMPAGYTRALFNLSDIKKVYDSSGYGNIGTNYGASTGSSELVFNGGDYVNCSNDSILQPTAAISIAAEITPSVAQEYCWDGSKGNYGVASSADDVVSSSTWSWQLRYGEPDNCYLGFQLNTGAGAAFVNVSQNLTTNQKYWVIGTFNGSASKIYLDNTLKNTHDFGTTTITTNVNNNLYFGVEGWNNFFNGSISTFLLYDKALTQSEVNDIVGGTIPREGLRGEWLFGGFSSLNNIPPDGQKPLVPFYNVTNTGSESFDLKMQLNGTVSTITTKLDTNNNPDGAKELNTSWVTVYSGLAPDNSVDIWLWSDFDHTPAQTTNRTVNITGVT